MKKIILCGVGGNLGGKTAEILLEKYPHEQLIFTSPLAERLEKYAAQGVDTRIADFNDAAGLADVFTGADVMILISMPFVGQKRRDAHKNALDAAVRAGVQKIVYTSVVGAGCADIDAYEVNDHVWFEQYIRSQPIHHLILRNSQYAEAMITSYIFAHESNHDLISNNMGDGKMALISRLDCAKAAAAAAMSEWEDRVIDVNGAQLLTISEFLSLGNAVTGLNVRYDAISDEENYAFFDAMGVPRKTEGEWAGEAAKFPYCSDGMVSFGRAIRKNQMAVFTDDFKKLTGDDPIPLKTMFEHMTEYQVGARNSVDTY